MPNRPVAQAISQAQQVRSFPRAEVYHGVVSPCSVCLNQRDSQTPDGRPACPRRAAAANKKQIDSYSGDSSFLDIAVLTGVDGGSDTGTSPLSNPVYDDSTKTILVWVATTRDNPPLTDASSRSVISPGLLDPNFSTDWIICRRFPATPRDTEAQYFQKGALMEGDQIELNINPQQQIEGDSSGDSEAANVLGTVRKVNFHSLYPRQPVDQDHVVPGT